MSARAVYVGAHRTVHIGDQRTIWAQPSVGRAVRVVAATGLAVIALHLVWSLLPLAVGWRPSVVLTGSMAPVIRPGDVVVFEPPTPAGLAPGRVVLFDDPARPGTLITHRIVAVRPDGALTTKGDANLVSDSTPVPPERVVGVARLLVPYIGRIALLSTPSWPDALGWLVVVSLALWGTLRRTPEESGESGVTAPVGAPARPGRRRRPRSTGRPPAGCST